MATALLWIGTIIGYWIGPETAGKELEEVQL
jgi:putative MFS transporter